MPASDTSSPPAPRRNVSTILPDKAQIKKWTRPELEERYMQTVEENMQLKIRINEQDEHLRKQQRSRNLLATKLLKVTKAQPGADGGSAATGGGQQVDLVEVHNYIFELEQQNMLLRDKLKSAKYQLNAYTRFPLAPGPGGQRYPGGTSGRTSRGTSKPGSASVPAASPSEKIIEIQVPAPVDNTLLRQAEETIGRQRQQIAMYEAEISALKQQVNLKQVAFDDELARLQSQITSEQRSITTENIEIIRMQKVVRDQANEISVLQVRTNKYEMELRTYKSQHQQALMEIDQLKAKLHAEQTISSQLQMELRTTHSTQNGNQLKMTQEVETLRRENEILKESNDLVLANAFNVEREKQWEITERSLRSQLATLDAAVKADAVTRNEILERLAGEIAGRDILEQQLRKLEVQNVQLKAEVEHVQQKLHKLTTAQGVEYTEIEEAITYVRQKKQTGERIDLQIPDFVTQLPPDETQGRNVKEQLTHLQLTFAETVQELEKTRNMLLIQYKINQDFKLETDEISQRSERLKEEYERKLKEYSAMLDERALRIQKLERQLYDLAYGTRAPQQPLSKKQEIDITALEPGRNLLELHLSELKLTDDALRLMQSSEPNTFLTIEFYDFEIQFTPMLSGARAPMDFTCQYNVVVNDLFLHYMQNECAHVELHQAVGSHYKTWAAGKIYLKDIVGHEDGKIFGTAEILGINSEALMVSFGEVRFSIQLHVPAERALRFYKDRVKSLGYIVDNNGVQSGSKTNQLHVHLHRCRDLKSKTNDLPSVYAVYHFYEFPDHDTKVAPPNSSPELADHAAWPVNMDKTFDQYLRQQTLRIHILDDSAPDDAAAYIGHADIPLLPLAHNKTVTGTFRLINAEVESSGSIDVSLNWQFAYSPPPDVFVVAEPMVPLPPPTEIMAPIHVAIEAEKAAAIRRPQPAILPEPPSAPEIQKSPSDQTVVQIDRDKAPSPTAAATEPQPGDQKHEIVEPHPPLKRSATFDKLKEEEVEQPQKTTRKTWEKKPPTAPRRTKNGNGHEPTGPGPQHEPDADSSPGRESDSDIVVGSKSVKAQITWPNIVLDIHSLHLPEHSPLLKDEKVKKIFLEWSFLDLPPDECETPFSFEKPDSAHRPVDINLHKNIPVNAGRAALLKTMLSSNENLVLTLISDPGDEGECIDLGTAAIDFKSIFESERDLEHDLVDVVAPDGHILAKLNLSLTIIEAMQKAAK